MVSDTLVESFLECVGSNFFAFRWLGWRTRACERILVFRVLDPRGLAAEERGIMMGVGKLI